MARIRRLAIFVLGIGVAASLAGQATTGNLYVRVLDEQNGVLPGVAATLSGCGAPMTTTTGTQGDFRFLNLAPCLYSLRTELSGFATVERDNVVVNLGANTELSIVMRIAAVEATVTVTSESPLLDSRKQAAGANFSQQELKSIPTVRDPWVILQQTPGVLVDNQNVGGSESGAQSLYVGKGTDPSQNAWNVDGVTITDMSAAGSSPTYYDFDAFQEMQATTGGSDPSIAVPGVTLNMVTKRGTNEVHGSARFFDTPRQLEAYNTRTDFREQQQALGKSSAQNRIDNIQDYGVEAGGPLWPGKAWLWGSYGRNQIDRLQASGTPDKTTLEDFSGKLNVQPIESNSMTGFYFRGDKLKFGRGGGPNRPQPTTWDQSGPTTIWKGEDSQVFGPTFVADISYDYVDGGFKFVPEGGNRDMYRDVQGVWQNSYDFYSTYRPQHQVDGNLSSFFNTGGVGHELKFGFGYRKVDLKSNATWPGSGAIPLEDSGIVKLTRANIIALDTRYGSAFLQDTMTISNLTVNLGVRYDEQYGRNLPTTSPARSWNDVLCDSKQPPSEANPCLPTLSYPGGDAEVRWKNWEPRVGLTWAIGAHRETLIRASYARFADQLGQATVSYDNPLGYSYLYCYLSDSYRAHAAAGNHTITGPGDLAGFSYAYGVDPNNPTAQVSVNQIDRHLRAPTTDEYTIGVDHQISPEFVAGLSYTHRDRKNFVWTPLIGLTSADYSVYSPGVEGYDWQGNSLGVSDPVYGVTGGYHGNFGRLETNRPGYGTKYDSVELQATKRLTNRWMAHGSFTWMSWNQDVGSNACQDPTNVIRGATGPACKDGSLAWFGGDAGVRPYVYINARWSFNVSGLYQLPMNFNASANLYGREGYPIPYSIRVNPGDKLGNRNVAIGDPARHRNSDLYELDMRLEKIVPLFQKADLTLSMDVFNVFNSNTVLQKQILASKSNAGAVNGSGATANEIYEIQAPRTLRFGVRLSF
ncbi:MAG TPA: TonB-dependent receptor [Thermoanaerobaculia bacterium]|nr:TonB-dependent receptor [Thermoanaerobaculia bacterium]